MPTIQATHNPPGCGCVAMVAIFLTFCLVIHPACFFIAISVIALLGAE